MDGGSGDDASGSTDPSRRNRFANSPLRELDGNNGEGDRLDGPPRLRSLPVFLLLLSPPPPLLLLLLLLRSA